MIDFCSTGTVGKTLCFCLLLTMAFSIGCGEYPLVSENRTNFAPWEKLPEEDGIRYVDKFVRDKGHDPIYFALITYEDEADLQKVVDTFGLVSCPNLNPPRSFVNTLKPPPAWYPLKNANKLYVYPQGNQQYVSNLWVDTVEKKMVLERSWW